ncbi:MAG: type II CAAX endopeptidase family protein [Tepidisphaeraceae bacterium]
MQTSPRTPITVWLSWLAVLLIAAGLPVLGVLLPKWRSSTPKDVRVGPDVQNLISLRNAIGAREVLPHATPTTRASSTTQPNDPMTHSVLEQFEKGTDTSESKRLQFAIATAELVSGNEALPLLKTIDSPVLKPDRDTLAAIYTFGPDAVDAASKRALVDRWNYLGEVATTYGKTTQDPGRARVVAAGRRTLITVFGALGVVGLAGCAGFVLLIVGVVLLSLGKLHTRYARDPSVGPAYLESFAIYLVSYLGISILMGLAGLHGMAWSWLLAPLIVAVACWPALARREPWPLLRQGLGWHTGRGLLIEVPLGVVGYVAGLPVVLLGLIAMLVLNKFAAASPSHPIVQDVLNGPWTHVAGLYALACVFAPIAEETMFRGALQHHLRRRWNWIASGGLTSLIFAAIHPQGWTAIPVLGAIGLVLSGIREWRGTIVASMTAHALSNAFVTTLLVLAAR